MFDTSKNFFRPQRGSLDTALAEAFNFDDMNDLLQKLGVNTAVRIKYYAYDPRFEKDSYIVLLEGNPIGFVIWGD